MSDLRRKVGLRVRQLRENQGLTQDKLAEKAELSSDTIGYIERGQRAPSFSALERLAKVLGVEERELFSFQGSVFKVVARRPGLERFLKELEDMDDEAIHKLRKMTKVIFK